MKSSSMVVLAVSGFASIIAADSCNHDNLLRCLIGSASAAAPYCSGVISVATSTVTIATVTPMATATVIGTVTITPSVTETVISTTVFTPSATDIESTTTTATTFIVSNPAKLRRSAAASPFPHCLTDGTSFPASRISSACSCLTLPPSTATVTATAPVVTITTFLSATVAAPTTTILTSTTDVITTDTVTTTTTAITVIESAIAVVCGIYGFGNAADDLKQIIGPSSFSECQGNCLGFPGCVSFGFGLNVCALYNQRAILYVSEDPSSPYTFYDIGCPAPAAKVKVRGLENRNEDQGVEKDIDGN